MKIVDLDTIRPEQKIIRLGGKDIDVSFIPCGITFEVDSIIRELSTIGQDKILENGDDTNKAFNLSVKLCSTFCSHKYPELDEEWFFENTDAKQIQAFSKAIQESLINAYLGIDTSKNLKAGKKKSH